MAVSRSFVRGGLLTYSGINNELLLARNGLLSDSCPRAKHEGNCDLRGTDNVQGKLFVHISEAKRVNCLYFLQIFPLTAKAAARNKNKTKHKAKHVLSQQVS